MEGKARLYKNLVVSGRRVVEKFLRDTDRACPLRKWRKSMYVMQVIFFSPFAVCTEVTARRREDS